MGAEKKSGGYWLMVAIIAFAGGLFANAFLFFILMMFISDDGDTWVRWYIGGDHHYFLLVSVLLAAALVPLVKRISFRLE